MNIRFFIAIIFFTLSSVFLFGQQRVDFRIRDLIIQLSENNRVEVIFSIEFVSDDVTRKGGLLLTPTIINNENRATLTSIYADKQKSKFGRFKIAADSLILLETGVSTNYFSSIPFEEWMNGAGIELDIVRVSRKQSIISSKMLRNNIVLEKKSVASVKEVKKRWHVTDKLEFIFSPKGLSQDIIENIVSGDNVAAIDALLKLEKSNNVWNTLGVAYGYNGEYDKARHCFEMAEKGGLSVATLNINELNKKVVTINI